MWNYVYPSYELYHHGVRGQKWGKKNGPPYPLAASAHSASEKKAGWKKSLSGGSGDKVRYGSHSETVPANKARLVKRLESAKANYTERKGSYKEAAREYRSAKREAKYAKQDLNIARKDIQFAKQKIKDDKLSVKMEKASGNGRAAVQNAKRQLDFSKNEYDKAALNKSKLYDVYMKKLDDVDATYGKKVVEKALLKEGRKVFKEAKSEYRNFVNSHYLDEDSSRGGSSKHAQLSDTDQILKKYKRIIGNKRLSFNDEQRLNDSYIKRMNKEEVKKLADISDKMAKEFVKANDHGGSWEKFEQYSKDADELIKHVSNRVSKDDKYKSGKNPFGNKVDNLAYEAINREHVSKYSSKVDKIRDSELDKSSSEQYKNKIKSVKYGNQFNADNAKRDAYSDVNRMMGGNVLSRTPDGQKLNNKRDREYMKRVPYDTVDSLYTRGSKKAGGTKASESYAREYSRAFDEAVDLVRNNKYQKLTNKGKERLNVVEDKKPNFITQKGSNSESKLASRVKQMRASGKTYAQISEALQISEASVGNLLKGKYK